MVISILRKNNYQKLLVVFDGGGVNFRKSLLVSYKAQREGMPENLVHQMETLKSLLVKTNIPYIQIVNHEADDLIASFITQIAEKYSNLTFDIFTRDKDMLQLINQNTNILKYINGKITLYTQECFDQEYNFSPRSYVDYLSLLGDSVDNIEGVKGIGPVNAKFLIQQFSALENIYQKIKNRNYLLIINKIDEPSSFCPPNFIGSEKICRISAKEHQLTGLENKIEQLFASNLINNLPPYPYLSQSWQQAKLVRLIQQLKTVISELEKETYLDALCSDLEVSYKLVKELSGKEYNEDLLDIIFSKFCLGK